MDNSGGASHCKYSCPQGEAPQLPPAGTVQLARPNHQKWASRRGRGSRRAASQVQSGSGTSRLSARSLSSSSTYCAVPAILAMRSLPAALYRSSSWTATSNALLHNSTYSAYGSVTGHSRESPDRRRPPRVEVPEPKLFSAPGRKSTLVPFGILATRIPSPLIQRFGGAIVEEIQSGALQDQ